MMRHCGVVHDDDDSDVHVCISMHERTRKYKTYMQPHLEPIHVHVCA
jgi:hypothetical protein